MKKFILFSLCVCSLMILSCSEDDWNAPDWAVNGGTYRLDKRTTPLTRDEAWDLVRKEIFGNGKITVDIHESLTMLEPGTKCDSFYVETFSPNFRSWFFFLQEEPWKDYKLGRFVFVSEYGDIIEVRKNTESYPYLVLGNTEYVYQGVVWPEDKYKTRSGEELLEFGISN